MTNILPATVADVPQLTALASQTFFESHGHSAAPDDIENYISRTYTTAILKQELDNPVNIYHILYHNEKPAGFSKIIYNSRHRNIPSAAVTKLERIYLLKEFYGLQLGQQLFDFNLALSKRQQQQGMWLFVWKENQRAFDFYTRQGFVIVGEHDFQISETHYNPNYLLYLAY